MSEKLSGVEILRRDDADFQKSIDNMLKDEKRDYVKEAYETFIKNAEGLDPTDPVKAVEAYFEKNATDELKARCKAEGKDAKKCWEFITAVARKVGGNCHIDPGAVYAMAMHYFEDVPVDWSGAKGKKRREKAEVVDKVDKNVDKPKRSKAKVKKPAAKVKAKKARGCQGFFFELLDAPEEEGGEK